MIKILIADDHPLIREGLNKILLEKSNMNVVGELGNGSQVLNYVKDHDVDIVLLDISMPGKSGLDVLRDLKITYPNIPVLILSIHSEERFAIRALKAGAAGYITKGTAPEKLVNAITRIISGGKYISENLAEKLANEFAQRIDMPPHETLSDREHQVMCMIASGKKVKDIAAELSLSPRTIYSYRFRILHKMKMNSDADLILYAIRNNLID